MQVPFVGFNVVQQVCDVSVSLCHVSVCVSVCVCVSGVNLSSLRRSVLLVMECSFSFKFDPMFTHI